MPDVEADIERREEWRELIAYNLRTKCALKDLILARGFTNDAMLARTLVYHLVRFLIDEITEDEFKEELRLLGVDPEKFIEFATQLKCDLEDRAKAREKMYLQLLGFSEEDEHEEESSELEDEIQEI